MTRYKGSCHCGHVKFSVDLNLDHVRVCDCSICIRRGALIHRVEQDKLVIETPLNELSQYKWGSKTAVDYFCSNCGILPFRKPSDLLPCEIELGVKPFNGWAINVRCLDGVSLEGIKIKRIKGSALALKHT